MKKIVIITAVLIIFHVSLFSQDKYEVGVILLQVKQPDVVYLNNIRVINGSSAFQAILDQYGLINSRKLSHVNAETDGWYRLEFPKNCNLKMIRSELSSCQDIRYVTFNYFGVVYSTPNDSCWPDQWPLQKIQMPLVWDISKSDHNILVGIIDTGIEYTHEDLIDNIWQNLGEDADGDGHTLEFINNQWVLDPGDVNNIDDDDFDNNPTTFKDDLIGWDFVDNDKYPDDASGDYHGTQVSGIVAAKTYNNKGIAGVAGGWQSQLGIQSLGLRVIYPSGYLDQEKAAAAINYLTKLHQHGHIIIANMSCGLEVLDDDEIIEFKQAIEAARDEGVILVAAAGNTNTTDTKSPYYMQEFVVKLPAPARWEGVLAIGMSKDGLTLQAELRAPHSLYDQECRLLMVAPVKDRVSDGIDTYTTYHNNSYRNDFSGTSAASPIVAGVVALMLSVNSNLSYDQIEEILARTAEKIGNYTYYPWLYGTTRSYEVGYGRINAYQSLLFALAYANKTPNISPTIYNNQRILARGQNNPATVLHEVFAAGVSESYEIFYRAAPATMAQAGILRND